MTMSEPRCPTCGSPKTAEFLHHDNVPVHQNLVLKTQDEALHVARGELALTACAGCGFVFNRAFDPGKLTYGATYDNTQSHSPYFSTHMTKLANHLIHDEGVQNCRIVEVGCGKGEFLRSLVGIPHQVTPPLGSIRATKVRRPSSTVVCGLSGASTTR